MQVKPMISALAISLAMIVTGPAFAQTVINGTTISAEDLPKVQARCAEITSPAGTPSVSDELETDDDIDDAKTANGGVASETTAAVTFDLDSLDAEACSQLTAK